MTVFQAIILGIIQGFAEFLPISSSAHLLILPQFFHWPEQGLDFDVAVHVATLGAIFIALRKDVWQMLRVPKLLALVLFGTLPIIIFGALGGADLVEPLRGPVPVAISLIVWGVALVVADAAARHHEKLPALIRVGWGRALFMGAAQVIALIPGTSRSGIIMTTGMVSGLAREDAARFAFLLAMPAIAAAGLLTLKDALEFGFTTSPLAIGVGMMSAFLSGLLAIQLLIFVARKASFVWFGIYRFALALLILAILV